MKGATIDVLLATYNGAKYLPQQLASLSWQDFTDWRLIVRDDGSSDDTLDILRQFKRDANVPVLIVEDGDAGLGPSMNFGRLLEHSDAPYFACCDQDDIWLPNKLSSMLAAIRDAEANGGGGMPILAHCDLEVVDGDLRLIAPSFRRFASLRTPPADLLLRHLMMQNLVTGCAMMGNAALRTKALPIPKDAMMHDWWLALVACAFGEIIEMADALVRYRQHGTNTLGAKRSSFLGNLTRFVLSPASSLARARFVLNGTRVQAEAFVSRFGPRETQTLIIYKNYAQTRYASFLKRKSFIMRNRVYTNSRSRTLVMMLVI